MNDKIRILFICDEIVVTTAGSEQHLSFLLNNLPYTSYDISLAVLRNHEKVPQNFSPIDPVYLGFHSFMRPFEFLQALVNLRRLILRNNINIVHTFFRDSEILASMAVNILRGCKLVVARRSLGYDDSKKFTFANRLTNKSLKHFLVNSFAIKRHLIEKERVSPNNVSVIYNPIDLERINPKPESVRDSVYGALVENNCRKVGIVANIRPIKDYETFFKAADIVCSNSPSTRFIVVGAKDPEYWKTISHLLIDRDLSEKIVFTGPVENPLSIVQNFDVGVLTSRSEGLSNSLIEYGAMGVASVATDVGGNREIILDGETGFVVPAGSPRALAEKIVELLKNNSKRKAFGRNAHRYVMATFGQKKIIEQYERFHRQLLS